LTIDQPWERERLFYPHVLRVDGVYLMWYGAYWSAAPRGELMTALGFAASIDGLKWYRHSANPVFTPDAKRAWESHFVTSHSLIRSHEDGSFRMWYASRKKPPFENKYFALNTAVWRRPPQPSVAAKHTHPDPSRDAAEFRRWQASTRARLRRMLGIPETRVELAPELRGQLVQDGVAIEKWLFTSEPGSRIPALLYRPQEKPAAARMPAIVLTFGHGGSKSNWQYHYAGQLYARLGLACLALDPIGEEERHAAGRMGTRAHDPQAVHERADEAGRLVMGKLLFDTMRGIDFLVSREDIDPNRIGVAGNSLGGAKASWMAALEPRLRMALVCGWAFDDITLRTKYCTKVPNQRMREWITWADYAALAAPRCAVLVMNGDADVIIDLDNDKSAWRGTDAQVASAAKSFAALGAPGDIDVWYEAGGGHRPYFANRRAVEWIHTHLGTPGWSMERIQQLPVVNGGRYCDANRIELEKLYGIELHERGSSLLDLGIRPVPRDKLKVLTTAELGQPEFTLEGWLNAVAPVPR
jgi:dienelactone hydrolase